MDNEVNEILSELKTNSRVLEMQHFIQHGNTSTYEHCNRVAKLSYRIDRRLSLHSDLNVLLVGAMLHDFYLYDWHNYDDGAHRLHGFTHAKAACKNAQRYFDIDDKTSRVIACHMWPLNIRNFPRSREEWIVCIADKCISLQETVFRR
ncbi:MAG: HD domain-containing protein [Clostridia bacterium]|nr:HD domain-containing protein [Clostridia bacterium]